IEIDLRIGAAFTRFQTMRLQKLFPALADKLISYGPCQFPTLGFVVERYNRLLAFVPESFWYLRCAVAKDGVQAEFKWNRTRLFDEAACLALYQRALQHADAATVQSVTTRPTSKWRPYPLTTVALQKLASSKLRISSDRTMQLAEALYNRGL